MPYGTINSIRRLPNRTHWSILMRKQRGCTLFELQSIKRRLACSLSLSLAPLDMPLYFIDLNFYTNSTGTLTQWQHCFPTMDVIHIDKTFVSIWTGIYFLLRPYFSSAFTRCFSLFFHCFVKSVSDADFSIVVYLLLTESKAKRSKIKPSKSMKQ